MRFEATIGPPPSGPICDFCSINEVWATYPAKDFNYTEEDGIRLNSLGNWGACKKCSELIEAGNWDILLDRSVQTFKEKYPSLKNAPGIRAEIGKIHRKFRDNRQLVN